METVEIRIAKESDIKNILKTFAVWHKTEKQFIDYLAKQDRGESILIVAITVKGEIAAYANLFWQSRISWHREQNIPEIVDLNVITEHQRKGVASQLIHYLEQISQGKGLFVMGVAVEPAEEYLPAKLLYQKLGYMEDGTGFLDDGTEVLVLKKELI